MFLSSKATTYTFHSWHGLHVSSGLETSVFNWKAYWQLKGISPRVHLFLWHVLHKSIALHSTMARFISSIDPSCPLCYLKPETADHIFLKCDVARQVWFGSHIGLTIDESDDTLTLTRLFNGWLSCPSLFEIAKRGCCLLWSIWKARNRKIFEHVDIDISEIIRTANNIFTEHDLNIPSLIQTQPAEIQSVDDAAQHGWDKLQHGCIKINVDGATGSGSIAAGVVARNEVGMALHCQSFYDGCWSGRDASIEAEARAFLKGLHLAAS
ncbi:Reverse transcriptase zinc-binding domain [Macleaya cordata]|uniref:Reverse transcriptase zinc-binding domain n=1 Tax=Macleaya cordata TaxID=56857 RepID=A0A200QU93_MACCD|nr:Reverse transcriptase zinc-binding domain [Macleaya cordata]